MIPIGTPCYIVDPTPYEPLRGHVCEVVAHYCAVEHHWNCSGVYSVRLHDGTLACNDSWQAIVPIDRPASDTGTHTQREVETCL